MNNPCYEYIPKLQKFDMIIPGYNDKSNIENYGYLIFIQIVHAVANNIMIIYHGIDHVKITWFGCKITYPVTFKNNNSAHALYVIQ